MNQAVEGAANAVKDTANDVAQYDNQSYQYQDKMSASNQQSNSELTPVERDAETMGIYITAMSADNEIDPIIRVSDDEVIRLDNSYE